MLKYLLILNDPTRSDDIASRVAAKFPIDTFRRAGTSAWFIKSDLGTQQISETIFDVALGHRDTKHSVVRFDAFWGWNDKALWEWLSG